MRGTTHEQHTKKKKQQHENSLGTQTKEQPIQHKDNTRTTQEQHKSNTMSTPKQHNNEHEKNTGTSQQHLTNIIGATRNNIGPT